MHGKSCLIYWDTCVPARLNTSPQSLTHPISLNPTPFDLLCDRGLCTLFDSVMRVIGVLLCRSLIMSVIGVLSCRSLMFAVSVIGFLSCQSVISGMPVLDVCQACHR